ncbi:MAG: hypothetical protein HN826_07655 [Methylococcales bacterium]|nr:hypothetical protein [Methylococcales bacterium]
MKNLHKRSFGVLKNKKDIKTSLKKDTKIVIVHQNGRIEEKGPSQLTQMPNINNRFGLELEPIIK